MGGNYQGAFRQSVIVLSLLLLLITSFSRATPLEITKTLPFASADSVRVEATLKTTGDPRPIEVYARITRAGSGEKLWAGSLGRAGLRADGTIGISCTIRDLKPALWSPALPALYELQVTASQEDVSATDSVRFGFRSFENRGGRFFLNGLPIFPRGLAINPPGRTIPEEIGESRKFAEAYVRFLKSHNVNTIRLRHDSQVWFDVCDELGMLVYQGQYGSPPEADTRKREPPADFEKSLDAYKRMFEGYARHPSILIYVLANELPVSGARGQAFHEFLSRAHHELSAWDSTRLFIGNAGYGEGREGDICDVHRYWGWYYNTFLTYYNLRDTRLFGDGTKQQPLTFTECVGSFTGPSGEFNLIVRKQLGAQLNWTGHSANQRDEALRYQAFMVKQATESFRRLRPLNPRLSGVMPFTTLFYNWSGILSFDQMKPKPALEQLAVSYQPVLLSWELWTPQVYAGATIHPVAHVINDAENGGALRNATLVWRLESNRGKEVYSARINLPEISYYGTWSHRLDFKLPQKLRSGDYVLRGEVLESGRVVSQNHQELFVAGQDWQRTREGLKKAIWLYDPAKRMKAALRDLEIPFHEIVNVEALSPRRVLVLGEDAWDDLLSRSTTKLKQFVAGGGRVVCLRQNPTRFKQGWLPEPISFFTESPNDPTYPPAGRPFRANMAINPERPEHPIFKGIERGRLFWWSDYTDWDQTKPGFPEIYPVTAGFKLQRPEALATTAILADYDRGLEGVALCEMFAGEGSILLSGFDLVNRSGLDPIADRLLANLVNYAADASEHETHPFIKNRIIWGDYASERGLVCGPINGLLLNADWVKPPTNPNAKPLTQAEGAWNTRPGDQFSCRGRNPAGPYGYTTGSSLRDLTPRSTSGSAFFWARVPGGKRTVATLVENPGSELATIKITVNDAGSSSETTLKPGTKGWVTAAIPTGLTNLCVRFEGSKCLILLETDFK